MRVYASREARDGFQWFCFFYDQDTRPHFILTMITYRQELIIDLQSLTPATNKSQDGIRYVLISIVVYIYTLLFKCCLYIQ